MVSVPMNGVTGDTHIIAGGVPAQADLILTYIAGTEATGYSRGGYIAAYGRIVTVGRLVEAVIRITTRAITGTWSCTVVVTVRVQWVVTKLVHLPYREAPRSPSLQALH